LPAKSSKCGKDKPFDKECLDRCCNQIKEDEKKQCDDKKKREEYEKKRKEDEEKKREEEDKKKRKEEEKKQCDNKKKQEEEEKKRKEDEENKKGSGKKRGAKIVMNSNGNEAETMEEDEINRMEDDKINSAVGYQGWFKTVLFGGCFLTAVALTLGLLLKKVLKCKSEATSALYSTRIMVAEKLKELEEIKKKASSDKETVVGSTNELLSKEGKLHLIVDLLSTSDQMQGVIAQLKEMFKADGLMLEALNNSKAAPLGSFKLLAMVACTHHYILGLFYSNNSGSKATQLALVYTRFIYQLAISMAVYVTIGSNGLLALALTTVGTSAAITGLMFVIKKLLKDEGVLGLSLFRFINPASTEAKEPKAKVEASVPEQPLSLDKEAARNRSLEKENSKKSVKGGLSIQPFRKPGCPKATYSEAFCEPTKKTMGVSIHLYAGYALVYALVPLSIGVVMLAAKAASLNHQWPVPYWYGLSLLFDLTVAQVPAIAIQFVLFKLHMARRHLIPPKMFSSKPFFLDSSLAALTRLSDNIKLTN